MNRAIFEILLSDLLKRWKTSWATSSSSSSCSASLFLILTHKPKKQRTCRIDGHFYLSSLDKRETTKCKVYIWKKREKKKKQDTIHFYSTRDWHFCRVCENATRKSFLFFMWTNISFFLFFEKRKSVVRIQKFNHLKSRSIYYYQIDPFRFIHFHAHRSLYIHCASDDNSPQPDNLYSSR